MKAKLKEIYSIDTPIPLEKFRPVDPGNFVLSITLMIGLEETDGRESFDMHVCTPDWIKEQCAQDTYVWGRHTLVVLEYNFELIKRTIERYIDTCAGEDWHTIAKQLSAMGAWEFENYQP